MVYTDRMMKKKVTITLISILMALFMPVSVFAEPLDGGIDTYNGDMPELQNSIAQKAIQLAWPYGTSKSRIRYPGGGGTPAFKTAIAQVYGARKGWSAQCKAGASCDVFVGTVIRACGYDPAFPRALSKDMSYLPNSSKFTKVNITRASEFEPGDIILYNNRGPGGHIAVYVEINEAGYIAEASYTLKCCGRIARRAPDWHPSSFKYFGVFRANGDCTASFAEGDSSDEVKKLQEFLKWSGYFNGKVDGQFGEKTTKAVKKFQKDAGIEVTGEFDQQCLDAVKNYSKDSAGTVLSN